jgi:large subunit ribosomal protein L29
MVKEMKNKEIVGFSDVELTDKIQEEKESLNKMTLNHAISPLENPLKVRLNRRNVARLLTEQTKRNNIAK